MYGILPKKLHKDCSRTIEQDAPIGISKLHTNSKQKLKNSKTIWNVKMNNKEIRRTQNENDQELLILEEPMLMIPNDGFPMSSSWMFVEDGAEA